MNKSFKTAAAIFIFLILPQIFLGAVKKYASKITYYDPLTRLMTLKINPVLKIPPDFIVYYHGKIIGDLAAPENLGSRLTGIFEPYGNFIPFKNMSGRKVQLAYPGGKIPGMKLGLKVISRHVIPPVNCSSCSGKLIRFSGGENKGVKIGSYFDLYSGHFWTANSVIVWVGSRTAVARIIPPVFSHLPVTFGIEETPPQNLPNYSYSGGSSLFALYRVNAERIPSHLQNSLHYSDQHIGARFTIHQKKIEVSLANHGAHPLSFVWKECEYVDPEGNTHLLIPQTHSFLKMKVLPGETRNFVLTPKDGTRIGRVPSHTNLIVSTMRVILMLKSGRIVLPYQFFFAVNKKS
ncbi:MAG: hypothetical protein M1169_01525 [Firmicutes bacterium]|nr:hypothetical protein [Bacillota bacterium]